MPEIVRGVNAEFHHIAGVESGYIGKLRAHYCISFDRYRVVNYTLNLAVDTHLGRLLHG